MSRSPWLILAGLMTLPAGTAAQEGALSIDLGSSHARPPSGVEAEAATYLLGGLRVQHFTPSGTGVFAGGYGAASLEETSGDWVSGFAGGQVWGEVTPELALGLRVRGEAFAVGEPLLYQAATAAAEPGIRLRIADVELRAWGEGGVGRSKVEFQSFTGTSSTISDLWHYGGGGALTYSAGATAVTLEGGGFEASVGSYARGTLRLSVGTEAVDVTAELSAWDTPAGSETTGSVSLRVSPGDGWSLQARGGRRDPDPLLGAPAGVDGSLIVSRSLAEFGGAEPVRLYEVVGDGAERRTVRFTLRRPEAARVAVMGDFSGWDPVSMGRRDGRWTAELEIEPGTYHFGFLVDGEWQVPEAAPGRVTDEWGRTNATLVVPAR